MVKYFNLMYIRLFLSRTAGNFSKIVNPKLFFFFTQLDGRVQDTLQIIKGL